jgi:hypothetical protein
MGISTENESGRNARLKQSATKDNTELATLYPLRQKKILKVGTVWVRYDTYCKWLVGCLEMIS